MPLARRRPAAIEDLVERAETGSRPALLEELLILELELRRAAGESPARTEYRARFPAADLDRVEAAFAQAAARRRAPRDRRARPTTRLTTVHAISRTPPPLARFSAVSATTRCSKKSPGAAWASSTRPGSAGANRLVALKMILSGQMATADERERFLREAELAANLDHQTSCRSSRSLNFKAALSSA